MFGFSSIENTPKRQNPPKEIEIHNFQENENSQKSLNYGNSQRLRHRSHGHLRSVKCSSTGSRIAERLIESKNVKTIYSRENKMESSLDHFEEHLRHNRRIKTETNSSAAFESGKNDRFPQKTSNYYDYQNLKPSIQAEHAWLKKSSKNPYMKSLNSARGLTEKGSHQKPLILQNRSHYSSSRGGDRDVRERLFDGDQDHSQDLKFENYLNNLSPSSKENCCVNGVKMPKNHPKTHKGDLERGEDDAETKRVLNLINDQKRRVFGPKSHKKGSKNQKNEGNGREGASSEIAKNPLLFDFEDSSQTLLDNQNHLEAFQPQILRKREPKPSLIETKNYEIFRMNNEVRVMKVQNQGSWLKDIAQKQDYTESRDFGNPSNLDQDVLHTLNTSMNKTIELPNCEETIKNHEYYILDRPKPFFQLSENFQKDEKSDKNPPEGHPQANNDALPSHPETKFTAPKEFVGQSKIVHSPLRIDKSNSKLYLLKKNAGKGALFSFKQASHQSDEEKITGNRSKFQSLIKDLDYQIEHLNFQIDGFVSAFEKSTQNTPSKEPNNRSKKLDSSTKDRAKNDRNVENGGNLKDFEEERYHIQPIYSRNRILDENDDSSLFQKISFGLRSQSKTSNLASKKKKGVRKRANKTPKRSMNSKNSRNVSFKKYKKKASLIDKFLKNDSRLKSRSADKSKITSFNPNKTEKRKRNFRRKFQAKNQPLSNQITIQVDLSQLKNLASTEDLRNESARKFSQTKKRKSEKSQNSSGKKKIKNRRKITKKSAQSRQKTSKISSLVKRLSERDLENTPQSVIIEDKQLVSQYLNQTSIAPQSSYFDRKIRKTKDFYSFSARCKSCPRTQKINPETKFRGPNPTKPHKKPFNKRYRDSEDDSELLMFNRIAAEEYNPNNKSGKRRTWNPVYINSLFEDSKLLEEIKTHKSIQAYKKRKKAELSHCTFKPSRTVNKEYEPLSSFDQRVKDWSMMKFLKQKMRRRKSSQERLKECTFFPSTIRSRRASESLLRGAGQRSSSKNNLSNR